MTAPEIHGHVAAGFEKVADAFVDNFRDRGDTGAACAVYADGKPVIDIWAGHTARGPWTPNTRSILFSVSKGITTICVLMAVEAGVVDLDEPVATYWPEYAANGKQATTVRQLLAHQAGLPAPQHPLTAADLAAWHPATDALAAQAPLWKPGTTFAYHAMTFGWLAGEVLRRTTGKRPAEWLAQHIAGPLALNATFGIDPDSADFATQLEPLPITDLVGAAAHVPADIDLSDRAMTMAGALGRHGDDLFLTANSRDFLSIENPGGNIATTARDLGRLYAATIGYVDGSRLLRPDTVMDARRPMSWGTSYVGLDDGNRWGTGFMIDSPRRGMAGPGSFGHDGAGGQLGFANPELNISFGYQTIRPGGYPDDRAEALCDALRACL
jgi:CubicO group peptidase (beta-lactamase class C family)